MSTAVFPGSFDPVTLGHVDLIRRAAVLFDQVIVAVGRHPSKKGCFPVDRRMEMLGRVCADYGNVSVQSYEGLTVDFLRKTGAHVMVRGIRNMQDMENERMLSDVNRRIDPETETVLLFTDPAYADISSSVVRELGSYHRSLKGLVPECVRGEIENYLADESAGR